MHTTVDEVRALKVNVFSIWLDNVGSNIASDVEHAFIVLDSIVEVDGCILIFIFVGEVALFELYHALHFRMIQIKIILWMVGIIVSHFFIEVNGR